MTALDARYGRTARRRGVVAAVGGGALLLVAALAWALWTGVGGTSAALEVDTTSVTVDDDGATTVEWLVTGRPGTALVCAVEAQDRSGVVVGLVERTLPATGQNPRGGTTTVRTVRRASTGLIASCRDA